MARYHNPKITTNKNLSLVLDAANPKSYTGVTTSVTTTIEDPYADNVSLLLNGNGTNGSTTFTDSSSYGHTVTPAGNAQISTTQSKFGGASIAFDGNGDRVAVANNNALNFGTGDFTVECWVRSVLPLASYTIQFAHICGKGNGVIAGTYALAFYQSKILFFSNTSFAKISTSTLTNNTWYHFAASRSGSTLKLFVDGVEEYSGTDTTNYTSSASFNAGDRQASDPNNQYPFHGYIDDLRITKGVARYTSNFTPPTAELYLSTTETQQAPVLTDISLNNNTAILYNGVGYTSSNVGYFTFDGTNDYMEIPYDESVNLTDGDFTIDFWMNSFSDQTSDVLVSYGNTSTVGGWAIKTATNKLQYSVGFATHPALAGIVTSGLVLHLDVGNSNSYPGTGNTWYDLSGNENNGTLVNGVGYDSANGGSLTFDGSNDYVSFSPTSANLNLFPITLSFWATPGGEVINKYTASSFNGYRVSFTTDGISGYYFRSNSSYTNNYDNSYGSGTVGTFSNGVMIVDASGVKFYLNGLLVGSNTWNGSSGATTTSVNLQLALYYSFFRNGNIAQVAIYDKALTPQEITQNYNALKGRYTSQPSPLDSLDLFNITENADFSSGITTNTWNHYALVRSGNVYTPYVNAVPGNPSYDYSADLNRDLYFDNASIILNANGDNGSTSIIDSSPNNHTGIITAYNGAGISTAESKFGGSSLYFDGTDDYIDCGTDSSYAMEDGDFTIEFWMYTDQNQSSEGYVFRIGPESNNYTYLFDGGLAVYVVNGSGGIDSIRFEESRNGTTFSSASITRGQWNHIAWTRSGSNFYFFVNGTNIRIRSIYRNPYNESELTLGSQWYIIDSENNRIYYRFFNGYIDDFIITKGVAKYTSDFTPPNQASYYSNDPNYDNLSLLLQGNGQNLSTSIIDSSPNNHTGIITAYNGAGISTAEYKFGGSSLYFDGTDDYINCGISSDYSFGNDPFTIEFWMRVNTSFFHTSENTIFSTTRWYGQFNHLMYNGIALKATIGYYGNNPNGVPYVLFSLTAGTTSIGFLASDYVSRGAFFHDNWGHIAISCDGTNFKCFCNGVLASTINAYNQPYEGDHLIIGGNQIAGGNNPNVNDFINAYIDDFRITKGVAKYTEDFIPPDRTKIQNNEASLKFGASGTNNSNPFNGALSNLKIYKDSLTQSEITQNYNAHKSRYSL